MQPRVLQEMEEAGFPVDVPHDLAPHQKEARQAAQLAVVKALEADAAERLAHTAAEAARAAAARDPAYAEAQSKQQAAQEQQGTSLEEMDRLMEGAPMKLLLFEDLLVFGAIPRSNDAVPHKYLSDIPAAERLKVCIVFLSHRWFAPHLEPKKAHPDKRGLKFAIIIKSMESIKNSLEPGTKIYLWIDFFCIDQDSAELKIKGIMSLPAYIYNSDCLLTPYTDKVFDDLAPGATYRVPPFKQFGLGWSRQEMKQFKSLALDLPDGYFGRGWCRQEMYCATALKVKEGTCCYFLRQGIAARAEQRPHFLAGDHNNGIPFLLPPLANSMLRALNPIEGHLTSAADRVHLQTLVDQNPPPPEVVAGYWGERGAAGESEGHGVRVHEDGERYEGLWRGGLQHGSGVATYSTGHVYAGDGARDLREGAGVVRFVNGKVHRGQFSGGARAGHGVTTWPNGGGRYAGGWADNCKNGPGVRVEADGRREEGRWERNLEEGRFTITWPNGEEEVSEWRGGQRHGAYSLSKPDGTLVEISYVNGQPEGQI
ncbi:unnamed protein product [Heterosigma akashiwo]